MKATTSLSASNRLKRLGPWVLGAFVFILAVAVAIAAYLGTSFYTAVSTVDGSISLSGLRAPVQIVRDERDIPHIRAQNEHDMYFAQGFAEGSDRLFQFDLTRHFVYGRLAEWFGNSALKADQRSRTIDVNGIVQRQWLTLSPRSRDTLDAFAEGVNAAMAREPVPFEYRLLFLRPQKWEGVDCLAVGFATVLALADGYRDVMARDAVFRSSRMRGFDEQFPLSDPKYDAPVSGTAHRHDSDLSQPAPLSFEPRAQASNEWAAGAAHTTTGRALLANDPHLDLSIPGIWYLVDLQAPGFHAAGASLAGTPGVILGHNDTIAWGATNGTVAALSLFTVRGVPKSAAVAETFRVRFHGETNGTYYRDKRGFYVHDPGGKTFLVAWTTYSKPGSPLEAFDGLDRARSIEDGIGALAKYPGPTQNFVLASTDGRAAYTLAGWIPNDPLWARHAHDDAYRAYPILPFSALPHVAPSRDAIVWTSNNRMYGNGYPYRLSATFSPPYRAYEVWRQLHARKKYDVTYFANMQNDTYSVAEHELAQIVERAAQRHPELVPSGAAPLLRALRGWDGYMRPDSRAATIAHALRVSEVTNFPAKNMAALLQTLRASEKTSPLAADRFVLRHLFLQTPEALLKPWSQAGSVQMLNPLNSLGVRWLDGAVLPGVGDNYTVHAQNTNFNQSFRAVWDVGNWDAGGIVIPAGESGEPGSPHYMDLTSQYESPTLGALPYSNAAVARHTVKRQSLLPP